MLGFGSYGLHSITNVFTFDLRTRLRHDILTPRGSVNRRLATCAVHWRMRALPFAAEMGEGVRRAAAHSDRRSKGRRLDEAAIGERAEGTGTMTTGETYAELSNQTVSAANGVEYMYRDVGEGGVPLVLLQHFRGNLDNWDPALIDELASSRRVVTFDNVGVGGTTGNTPHRVDQMAQDAIAFLSAMEFDQVDILGFSIGSFIAQEIALSRPALLRRVILASSAPQGAAGMHGWAPDVIEAVGGRQTNPEGVLDVFYAPSASSRQAGQQALKRMFSRTRGRDLPTTWGTREAQYDAVCAWGVPNHSVLERVSAIDLPVFVANGDSDPMILPHYTYLLAGLIPRACVKIYPDSAHGFLFQHHSEFADDVQSFLDACR
jgi:pimeloyl-ACP methyl ester carboxylesterase